RITIGMLLLLTAYSLLPTFSYVSNRYRHHLRRACCGARICAAHDPVFYQAGARRRVAVGVARRLRVVALARRHERTAQRTTAERARAAHALNSFHLHSVG